MWTETLFSSSYWSLLQRDDLHAPPNIRFRQSLVIIGPCLFALSIFCSAGTNRAVSGAAAVLSEPLQQHISNITGNELSKQTANLSPQGHPMQCSPIDMLS